MVGRIPGDDRAANRGRLTGTVFAAVAFGSTALYAAYTVAPLAAADLSGSESWGGVPGASALLGTAIGSAFLSTRMVRAGRRAGLVLGWILGLAGATLALIALQAGSTPLLFGALLLVGVGHSSNQLARFAAADMHPPARRAFVLGWVVWAGTIGAGVGPGLLRPVGDLTAAAGLGALAGGFVIAGVAYLGATMAGVALSPDPSAFGGDGDDGDGSIRGLHAHIASPQVGLALAALVAAQVAMILVMTMSPVHLRSSGHGLGVIGPVMSAHFVGMFAFAPLMGKVVGRIGHAPAITIGGGLLLVAISAAGAIPAGKSAAFALALVVLGLGWCLAFVSGSALLTEGLAYRERVRVQGGVDALVWTASAGASLVSGVVVDASSFLLLCVLAGLFGLVPAGAAWGARRRPAAGRLRG